jgi:hypothetical protein
MDLLVKHSQGANIVVRPQSRARWYPSATTHPVQVEIWWRLINEDGTRPPFRLLGVFGVGQKATFAHNPDIDKDIEVSAISISAAGMRSVSNPDDGVRATILVRRDLTKPVIGVNLATADMLRIGVAEFKRFARKRKITYADNPDMTDASVVIFDSSSYVDGFLPEYIDISRTSVLVPDFVWSGNDPVSHGFTKSGTGTTGVSLLPAGWKIASTGSDAKTFYTRTGWPVSAFSGGFSLELTPPIVNASDGASLPNESVAVKVEDGSHAFELTFDTEGVKLNGGAAHAYSTSKIRLVISAGGGSADLWVGDTKVEDNSAAAATSTSGLTFGDLAEADDSEVIWRSLAYAFTPQDPTLAQTLYITVAQSSGSVYGPASDVLEASFFSESGGTPGSPGGFDPTPRDRFEVDL